MSVRWVEALGTNLLETKASHHRVEEDFQKIEMVTISGLHELDPLDGDRVLDSFMFSLVCWQVRDFSETEDAKAPVDEVVEFLFDLVSTELEHSFSHYFGVVRDFGLELDNVLVDSLYLLLIEVDLEVVRVEFDSSAGRF